MKFIEKILRRKNNSNQLLILAPNHTIHFSEMSQRNQIIIKNNINADKSYDDDE